MGGGFQVTLVFCFGPNQSFVLLTWTNTSSVWGNKKFCPAKIFSFLFGAPPRSLSIKKWNQTFAEVYLWSKLGPTRSFAIELRLRKQSLLINNTIFFINLIEIDIQQYIIIMILTFWLVRAMKSFYMSLQWILIVESFITSITTEDLSWRVFPVHVGS